MRPMRRREHRKWRLILSAISDSVHQQSKFRNGYVLAAFFGLSASGFTVTLHKAFILR